MKCIAALLLLAGLTAHAMAGTVVTTHAGKLRGKTLGNNVDAFLGIPYAASTAGENRWRPPQPVTSWQGVKSATDFGPVCVQPEPVEFGPWTDEFLAQGKMSEDCLSLNVWTPDTKARSLPVMIWIHGGGLTTGSSDVPVYDGAHLAGKGVVVVSINYRLGVLGFLAHPELEAENGFSGEYGLLDQIAALKWVHNNIAGFGGDPGNVTIAGQSAGAASVKLLMSTQASRGLYHKAIIQSGIGLSGFAPPGNFERALRIGEQLQKDLNASSLKALRELPTNEVLAAAAKVKLPGESGRIRFSVRQGKTFGEDLLDNTIPVLTGITGAEASAFRPMKTLSKADFNAYVERRYGELAEQFKALYTSDDDNYLNESLALRRDEGLVSTKLRLQQHDAPLVAYGYLFAHEPPGEPQDYASFHSGELPYMFGNLEPGERPYSGYDQTLSDTMVNYWVAFIKAKSLKGKLLDWPLLDDTNQIMVFGESGVKSVRPLLSKEKLALFERHYQNGGEVKLIDL
ncbi:carboxylesterase/lipase family protein [Alteromonas lipolytica]|uniref:Carboxylic ester hydrolase n=1 Tax=Alteromonas lipolytica TaxID=1856405 RepID=A0A1E8FI43_9ALTE|nr:carboxylesterase family protein [Alteromonas lipolytica]OFI35617.1 hypothetical protein BFC17_12745 [Alteromonas lipolytica]GGF77628.1 carboxylic ester hydrolase [Alteromonas lipolytica]